MKQYFKPHMPTLYDTQLELEHIYNIVMHKDCSWTLAA